MTENFSWQQYYDDRSLAKRTVKLRTEDLRYENNVYSNCHSPGHSTNRKVGQC